MIREEQMGPHMLKMHIEGQGAVIHQFTAPDHGDPHDHPWPFYSRILYGGYDEQVFERDGSYQIVRHLPGSFFHVPAYHIHRIVTLLEKECLTVIFPQPQIMRRECHFWQFHNGRTSFRHWSKDEWTMYQGQKL